MKKFFKEFKTFISRGNVVDLAVAVVIGAAFGKIVTSLVNDIIMPLISAATGGADVSDWKWVIRAGSAEGVTPVVAETALRYGNFIQTIIDFLIISFCIFIVLKILMIARKKAEKIEEKIVEKAKTGKGKEGKLVSKVEEVATNPEEKKESQEDVLKEIRDILKKQNSKK